MAQTDPFDAYPQEYDAWFDRHRHAFLSELEAIRSLLPSGGDIVEVGVGTGRFAQALGISRGVEPSAHMRWRAAARGIRSVNATAEALPLEDASLDAILMATVVCFLDDVSSAFCEAHRVLRPSGSLVVAFVDRESPLGRLYDRTRDANPFLRRAVFYAASEVKSLMRDAGFRHLQTVQTLFSDPDTITDVEPTLPGSGTGSFVVIRGDKTA